MAYEAVNAAFRWAEARPERAMLREAIQKVERKQILRTSEAVNAAFRWAEARPETAMLREAIQKVERREAEKRGQISTETHNEYGAKGQHSEG